MIGLYAGADLASALDMLSLAGTGVFQPAEYFLRCILHDALAITVDAVV